MEQEKNINGEVDDNWSSLSQNSNVSKKYKRVPSCHFDECSTRENDFSGATWKALKESPKVQWSEHEKQIKYSSNGLEN